MKKSELTQLIKEVMYSIGKMLSDKEIKVLDKKVLEIEAKFDKFITNELIPELTTLYKESESDSASYKRKNGK